MRFPGCKTALKDVCKWGSPWTTMGEPKPTDPVAGLKRATSNGRGKGETFPKQSPRPTSLWTDVTTIVKVGLYLPNL